MTDTHYDAATLREMTELRIQLHEPGYVVEPIVAGGSFLYDPQIFWAWHPDCAWAEPAGSILFSDIGGQPQDETDWRSGHGALYRLHADNRIETIMPPGAGRQAGVFRPIIAPDGWGEWGGHIFFGSQIIPHRRGAIFDHMIYRLAPGDTKPDAFVLPPRAGTLADGRSGALLTGVFGRPGTPEDGLFLIFSMLNCTVYAVYPDARIEPWIIMDGINGPGPLMPYRLYYADPAITGEEDMLVIEGLWGTKFSDQNHRYDPGHYRVSGRTVLPEDIRSLAGGPGHRAPAGFGPLAGHAFRPENAGFISSVHWTEGDASRTLPYNASIVRRDADGVEHLFASHIQNGQNLLGFTHDRLIVTNMGHSYSSGNFKYPDGSMFAIRYVGQ